MERFLKENFDYPAKNSSEEVHLRWRRAVGKIVLNRKRRFRMVADLDKRSEGEARRRSIQICHFCWCGAIASNSRQPDNIGRTILVLLYNPVWSSLYNRSGIGEGKKSVAWFASIEVLL
ncbi:putative calcium-transporting ATPase 4, plasma membrane-type [Platanthera guangdongensis]|uniref:Calcium-transporting ATPase 4, plasma membrane-type n=1 Tax=Platanthera guangdongensis TaxID=2320717 RepID=A0ABR2LWW9_9ASPA